MVHSKMKGAISEVCASLFTNCLPEKEDGQFEVLSDILDKSLLQELFILKEVFTVQYGISVHIILEHLHESS